MNSGPTIDLAVMAVLANAARCRELGTGREVLLRCMDLWRVVPGEIATIAPNKSWRYGKKDYLSGTIEGTRLELEALGIPPLRLAAEGVWDPEEELWGDEDEPLGEWARSIVEAGPRPQFEMEQILPGDDPSDPESDPILAACDQADAGNRTAAERVLMDLLTADLRCLDAHAHLGHLEFDFSPFRAVRHYEVGVRIGEDALGTSFDGVLPWTLIDNRPFLRCLKGYGLCLWRLDRKREAVQVFERMLRLNPGDEQGARFLLDPLRAGDPWEITA